MEINYTCYSVKYISLLCPATHFSASIGNDRGLTGYFPCVFCIPPPAGAEWMVHRWVD